MRIAIDAIVLNVETEQDAFLHLLTSHLAGVDNLYYEPCTEYRATVAISLTGRGHTVTVVRGLIELVYSIGQDFASRLHSGQSMVYTIPTKEGQIVTKVTEYHVSVSYTSCTGEEGPTTVFSRMG